MLQEDVQVGRSLGEENVNDISSDAPQFPNDDIFMLMSLCIIVCLTGAMHCESVEVQTGETQLQV
jgi:hypothetical protein